MANIVFTQRLRSHAPENVLKDKQLRRAGVISANTGDAPSAVIRDAADGIIVTGQPIPRKKKLCLVDSGFGVRPLRASRELGNLNCHVHCRVWA